MALSDTPAAASEVASHAPSRCRGENQVMVRGSVALTVVLVWRALPLLLRDVTVSVTFTVTDLVPDLSNRLGVPESTPDDERVNPAGRALAGATTEPLAHFRVVA
jgi:hypothetical protein